MGASGGSAAQSVGPKLGDRGVEIEWPRAGCACVGLHDEPERRFLEPSRCLGAGGPQHGMTKTEGGGEGRITPVGSNLLPGRTVPQPGLCARIENCRGTWSRRSAGRYQRSPSASMNEKYGQFEDTGTLIDNAVKTLNDKMEEMEHMLMDIKMSTAAAAARAPGPK